MGNGSRPTAEFRREAGRLTLTRGRTWQEIVKGLGPCLSTLTRWLGQQRDVGEPSEALLDLHTELKRLRRENAVLKQERDILKKAAVGSTGQGSIFDLRCSKRAHNGTNWSPKVVA